MSKRRNKYEHFVSHKRQRIEEPPGRRDRGADANSQIAPIHKPSSDPRLLRSNSKARNFHVVLLLTYLLIFFIRPQSLKYSGNKETRRTLFISTSSNPRRNRNNSRGQNQRRRFPYRRLTIPLSKIRPTRLFYIILIYFKEITFNVVNIGILESGSQGEGNRATSST